MTDDVIKNGDIVHEVEDVSREALGDVRGYFAEEEDDGNGTRVDRALKLLSTYSRIRATRANESAITVSVAKMMGVKGDALAPLWEQLTGRPASEALPHLSDDSSAAPGAGTTDQ